jgi:hypothetical protein
MKLYGMNLSKDSRYIAKEQFSLTFYTKNYEPFEIVIKKGTLWKVLSISDRYLLIERTTNARMRFEIRKTKFRRKFEEYKGAMK